MNNVLNIALAQMTSVDSVEVNLKQISQMVLEANDQPEAQRPRIIFFPENSLYFRIKSDEKLPQIVLDSSEFKALEHLSNDTNIHLHLTSTIYDSEKNWNASVLISPQIGAKIIYRKIHLFDITLTGDKSIRESDVFTHGGEVTQFDIEGFKFGSSVCYDIRFSELYHKHALAHVDAIVVPAAFLVKTGMVHWEILLKARAIESQCYVVAPAQWGTHGSVKGPLTRETFGHSMVVGPWGQSLDQKKDGIGLIYVRLDKEESAKVRSQIPMRDHRRI
jgi:deaminated glutathione amidase